MTTSDASHLLTSKMRSGFLSAENNETHFILLTDKMKIHRVHNYSYDVRLNESLDSRNAEKMLHNRKKRRETVL